MVCVQYTNVETKGLSQLPKLEHQFDGIRAHHAI